MAPTSTSTNSTRSTHPGPPPIQLVFTPSYSFRIFPSLCFPLVAPPLAGAKVLSGEVSQGGTAVWRVVRGGVVLWEGPCTSLRQHRAVVEAVEAGLECGVVLGGGQFSAFEAGDRLVCLRRGRA